MERSGRILPAQNINRKTLEVLLVGGRHELGDALVVLNRIKSLAPLHFGAASLGLELYGQQKVMPGEVLDLEESIGFDAGEPALIGVVLAVRSVHCQEPLSSGTKLELVNGVGEARRTPPSRDSGRIAHRGKDIGRTGCEYLASGV
jgi:hypothetical protein